jgi:CheY-like chemotaxis protein
MQKILKVFVPVDTSLLRENERVLLVEDEVPIFKLTTRILEQYGYNVTAEKDGQAAFEIFISNPSAFDRIVSDIIMPKLSGEALALQVLALRPNMPILLTSGFSKYDHEY